MELRVGGHWRLGKKIGDTGISGGVFLVTDVRTGEEAAVKLQKRDKSYGRHRLEVANLTALKDAGEGTYITSHAHS